ncbi:MAG: SDR family oxidoreductase [Candidatus Glassbacteria bacterium]|nr:SDR family oxidoreductase [Candidatus Glassbacteria bacterium]
MYPELEGKNAIVTGASRGFGREIAIRLAREGCNVIVNYRRSKSEAHEVVAEIEKLDNGVRAIALRGDVGDEDSLHKMFNQVKAEFDNLEIVIANAAFGVPGTLMGTTTHHFEVTLASSARSLMHLAQHAVPMMKNDWGRIVSITSEGGQKVLPGYGVIGPAKSALESITRYLAVELAPKGVVVNGVMAGPCFTRSLSAIPGAKELLEETACRAPMQRLIEAEDVARTVAFLCSDEAKMICGQFIIVDGGCSIAR